MTSVYCDNVVNDLQRLARVLGDGGHNRPDSSLLNIFVDPQLQIPIARTSDGKCISGTAAIGYHLVATKGEHIARQCSHVLTDAEKAAVLQWIEYRINRIQEQTNINRQRQLLKELNEHLEQRSYLVGSKCTVADLILSLALHGSLSRMGMLDREVYPHLGRWFEQVQRNCIGREKQQLPWNPKVVFSKTPL